MRYFFKTVAIVTVFSVCEKFLGFLYRIYLSHAIGTEGVGMYQVALSVFGFLLTVTCSGTPITVSRLMTKYRSEGSKDKVNKVITAGIALTLGIALPLLLLLFFARGKLSFLFADERCVSIFLVVLPGLAFTSVYSVLRGVFWGNKDFLPYSVIELLEEICMIIAGVILVSGAASAYQGAFRAGIAVLISYIFSFSLAAAVFFLRKNKLQNPRTEFRPLLASSAPVTAMRTINSLAGSLVSIIFPLRLVAAGFSRSQAMSLYGAAVGQAIPLLFVPTTLIGSFTLVLVPEISEDFYGKRNLSLKNNVEKAIKFTLLLSAIFVPVFFVCGEEIGILVFGSPECGNYLTAASFLMLFMGLDGVTTSILNSMGKEKKVLMYCAISGIFMLAAIWFLPSVMGVYALLAGYSAVYCVTTALNLILLHKTCPVKPVYIKYALKTVLLIIPAAAFGLMLERMLLPVMGTLLTFLTVSVLTAGFLCLLYMGAGLFDVNIAARFKRNKKRPAPGSGAGNKTAVKN